MTPTTPTSFLIFSRRQPTPSRWPIWVAALIAAHVLVLVGVLSAPAARAHSLEEAATLGEILADHECRLLVLEGKPPCAASNEPPSAEAGPDQSAEVGDVVQLDGSGSSDPEGDPLSWMWSFLAQPPGSAAQLDDSLIAAPSFAADFAGNYVLELAVSDGALVSAPDTVTITVVDPPPPPPPPPPSGDLLPAPPVYSKQVRRHRMVIMDDYMPGAGSYSRSIGFRRLQGIETLRVRGANLETGIPWTPEGVITIHVDGSGTDSGGTSWVPPFVASEPVTAVTLDTSRLPNGWRRIEPVSDNPLESFVPYFYFVHNGTEPPVDPAEVPVFSGTHDVAIMDYDFATGLSRFHWAMVPNRYQPRTAPLPAREAVPFSDVPPMWDLFVEQLIPRQESYTRRPHVVYVDGVPITTMHSTMPYRWAELVEELPNGWELDGPRGVSTPWSAVALHVNRFGTITYMTPWSIKKMEADGSIRTLAGWRHTGPLPHYSIAQDPTLHPNLELVGDASAMPPGSWPWWDGWGMAYQERTTLGGVDPVGHPEDVRLFVAGGKRDNLIQLTFSRDSETEPPVVTECASGLGDPWDVVEFGDVLYVGERRGDVISMWDADTCAPLGAFASSDGGDYAHVMSERWALLRPGVTHAAARAQDVVAPEGLYIETIDGTRYLYMCSIAAGTVKRFPLGVAGQPAESVETVLEFSAAPGAGTRVCKVSVSDGSFGPSGTVFLQLWGIGGGGWGLAYTPGSGWWNGTGGLMSESPSSAVAAGAVNGAALNIGYGSVAVPGRAGTAGAGFFYTIGSVEGALRISRVQPGDVPANNVSWVQGARTWRASGAYITHGELGWSPFGLEDPGWVSGDPDVLYFLEVSRR